MQLGAHGGATKKWLFFPSIVAPDLITGVSVSSTARSDTDLYKARLPLMKPFAISTRYYLFGDANCNYRPSINKALKALSYTSVTVTPTDKHAKHVVIVCGNLTIEIGEIAGT